MTVIVKCRYNRVDTLIGEDKVITGQGLSGKNLARALPRGEYCLHEFGGVMDHESPCQGAQKVKLCFVTGFQWALTEQMHDIPDKHFTLGYLLNKKLYIGICNNMPMFWPMNR